MKDDISNVYLQPSTRNFPNVFIENQRFIANYYLPRSQFSKLLAADYFRYLEQISSTLDF